MTVVSKDAEWNIEGVVTMTQAIATESMEAPDASFATAAITSATIPSLNGGTPMVTGGGGGSFGSASQIPTIQVAANGAVTIGTANIADNFTSNLNSTSDTQAATANALNQVYQLALAGGGGGANVIDSVTNTSITLAAAANSVKFAYDTAVAANSYAASIAATAFTNAAARADSAYSNAIAYSGNAALAYANAIAFAANATNLNNGTVPEARLTQANATTNGIMRVLDSVVNTSILIAAAANSVKFAYDTAVAANSYAASIAATAFSNAALRADAAYSNAIAYSGNAALAYANAVSYVDTNAAFRGVAQTISAVWTHSANLIPSANAINLGITDRRWLVYGTQADFSANVYIAGNLNVAGNLIVNGTTTTFDSTTLTVDDPIITLGGDTAPVADDNKDRGVEYRWHNGSVAKIGFFGYDDSTGEFTFIPDATNTSEVFSGTAGNVNFTKGTFTTLIGSIDASNVTSGTLPEARLNQANATTNGIMRVIDSVTNTSITIAASANSVKQAYDAAIASGSAATAYANAVAYANTNAAFRGVAQTISGAWTYSGNITTSANITPTTNAAVVQIGNTIGRVLLFANTIHATGLITGAAGATITGQANASTGFGSGTINATANGFFANATTISLGNSSVNVAITTAGITHAGGTGVNPASNTVGMTFGTSTRRWVITANSVALSGVLQVTGALSTLSTVNVTSTSELRGLVTTFANVSLANAAFYSSIPLATQANTLGLAHIIPEAQNGAYSILLDDFNQMKRFVTGAAASWTISNNSTTAYPLGFTFIARNVQANTLTVARGSGVTLRKAGSTTNTDVTIAQWGYVQFTQEDTNVWIASGQY